MAEETKSISGKGALQFLRGSSDAIEKTRTTLLPGQPLYNRDTHTLYVGSGEGFINDGMDQVDLTSPSESQLYVYGINSDNVQINPLATQTARENSANSEETKLDIPDIVITGHGGGLKLNRVQLPSESDGTGYTFGEKSSPSSVGISAVNTYVHKTIKSNGATLYWDDENNHLHRALSRKGAPADSGNEDIPSKYAVNGGAGSQFNFVGSVSNEAYLGMSDTTGNASLIAIHPGGVDAYTPAYELAFNNTGIHYRKSTSATAWDTWKYLLTADYYETDAMNILMPGESPDNDPEDRVSARLGSNPLTSSLGNLGKLATLARADHVHPHDDAKFNRSGGVISGNVVLAPIEISGAVGHVNDGDTNSPMRDVTLQIMHALFKYDQTTDCLKISFEDIVVVDDNVVKNDVSVSLT